MSKKTITKTALAAKLGISRASLYYTPTKPITDEAVQEQIVAVMQEHPAYGHRRIALVLSMNHKKIARIMKQYGLQPAVQRKRRPHKPADEKQPEIQRINVLKLLCPLYRNIVWVGDFTYFWFQGRFWYLATVMDVYTREVIGQYIGNHHTTALIQNAFTDAVQNTQSTPTYFHSDQGSEYRSESYQKLLKQHNTTPSYSNKSSPWQNGFQESFYSQFKLELGNINRFTDLGQFIEAIHQQIHYYNTQRIHSKLKMPPHTFKQQRQKQAEQTIQQLSLVTT